MKKNAKGLLSLIIAFTLVFAMLVPVSAASVTEAGTKATALKQLGLFKGVSDTDFALNRAPTRMEALVMLIRALGKESEALGGNWSHPFTDVDSWADKYVGYGYEKGLTKGVSAAQFGTGNADSDMYLTFMLRALGYSDGAGDFAWNAPETLAKAIGILPDSVDTSNFLRADVALVSWAALETDLKTGMQRLAKKLINEKVYTSEAYAQAIDLVGEKEPAAVSVSSFETLTAALSNSSVEAITIDSVGNPVIVTGELTIPAGVAVTVSRGNDFYIEGKLINNGIINVMGADSIKTDFINYSVLSIQKGGKFINNGAVNLLPASLSDTDDHGPIGGQLRVFDGECTNNGSVFLKAGTVSTHGGMLVVAEGPFVNNAVVLVDGFQIIIANTFTNNKGAVVINNTYVCTRGAGLFANNGTLSGNTVVEE